jgi:ABC-type dipeptide/oligopeptide/nickel transport system permease component
MQSIVRIIVAVIAIYVVVTMMVFALISLPEGDPAQVFVLGDHLWVREAKTIHRGIDARQHAAVRYLIWLGRVTRALLGAAAPTAYAPAPNTPLGR